MSDTAARWMRVKQVFQAALDQPPEERPRFLRESCGDDRPLLREVESLLLAHVYAGDFAERPAIDGFVVPSVVHIVRSDPEAVNRVLQPGLRLGPYQVSQLIGHGGMGEVYRARDTRLGRDVALKVLPHAFLGDVECRARFEREARLLAALNHPHIAAIYGLEELGEATVLVMELVEGPTLAERIARGAIPIDEALPIAKQITEALEAAHEQGIIHRDLKPANIKQRRDGTVKVLDFGLAKAMDVAGGNASSLATAPTMTTPAMTETGVILGTAAYMSPEQARGKFVGKRADIWAFGCVLYELLTGRRAFPGETVSDTIAAVLEREPDWAALPALPANVVRLLRRCLEKDSGRRLRDAGDARLDLEEAQSEGHADDRVTHPWSRQRERIVWTSVLVILAIAAGAAILWMFRLVPAAAEVRLEITTPPTTDPVALAISPDGQRIVFAATTSDGRTLLWLRSLNAAAPRPLAGTDYGRYPFWSPDSRSVGFFADGKLKRIDIDGGSVQTLSSAQAASGGTWNREGTILFGAQNGIARISATGGEPVVATEALQAGLAYRFPHFLPDGKHFLFFVGGDADARGVYAGQLGAPKTRRLFDAESLAVFASSGHLLFARRGTLFAQRFDPDRLVLSGDPLGVAERVDVTRNIRVQGELALSTSSADSIIYRTASTDSSRQLRWFDRTGREIGQTGDAVDAPQPSLSPDGRRVALTRNLNGNSDIWLLELGRGVLTKFTFDPATDNSPIWAPDGRTVTFSSGRKGARAIYRKPVDSTGDEELLLAADQNLVPMDYSRDGKFLLYRSNDSKTKFDIWALPLQGERKPFPIVRTNFEEREAQFAPDGKWIAYQSDESGRYEIYVQPFPGPGGKRQVSTNGGAQVRWGPDGKELFYIALDGRLMAAPIRMNTAGPGVEAGPPVALFLTRIDGGPVGGLLTQQYSVSADGQRFLMASATETPAPITVILNWKPQS